MNRVSLITILVILAAVTYSVVGSPESADPKPNIDRIASIEKRLAGLETRVARLESHRAVEKQVESAPESAVIVALRKQIDELNLKLDLNQTEIDSVPDTLSDYGKAKKLWLLYTKRERSLRKLLSLARKYSVLGLDAVQIQKDFIACQSDKKEQEHNKFDRRPGNRAPGSIRSRRPQ